MRCAARDVGFFYLSGHGIPQSLIDDVLGASRRFFALPDEDELKIEMVNSPQFRDYNNASSVPPTASSRRASLACSLPCGGRRDPRISAARFVPRRSGTSRRTFSPCPASAMALREP
ncbi:MAG: hypothetical protein EOS41_31335 [Mesorhizobium sp.]|uniref:2-oxoglutarate and iron-dependent oxygenase domain-containing protein n=1 Tax=Mesorhizobium sp. TaxID=1871066 RepID=UPI000FE68D4F|nr:MAG: hypothetical protein EOS41_31335 [Mesorhizobium sp.]